MYFKVQPSAASFRLTAMSWVQLRVKSGKRDPCLLRLKDTCFFSVLFFKGQGNAAEKCYAMVCHSGLLITVPFCYCQQWSCHRDVLKTTLPICNVWLSGINCILKWFFGSLSDSLTAQPLFLSLFCFLYYGVILRAVPWSESPLHRGNLRRHFTILAVTSASLIVQHHHS